MISREANAKRKSWRVAIPLLVEVSGRTYPARDWSVLGLGIEGLENVPAAGEIVAARLTLPLPESSLVLPVQLVFRGTHGGTSGFDFHELSDRNRRVLRHYIEMSLEGTLADAEQLVTAAALPAAVTPMAQPLVAAMPAGALPQPARAWGALAVGLAAVAAMAAVLFYNLAYKIEGTGFVSGSIARVTANHDGRMAGLLVRPGMPVTPQTALFTVENPSLRQEVQVLEQHVAQLEAMHGRLAANRRQADSGLVAALRRDLAAREAELANARSLMAHGAITQRDLMLVSDQASAIRQDYLREVSESAARTQSLDISDALQREKLELAAKKSQLAAEESDRTVRSPVAGRVFHVEKAPGEFVTAHDPVVLLETDVTPSVLLRLADEDALKLQPGMHATVYVPFQDRQYKASVAAVGLAAASALAPATQEDGVGQTLVRLEFEDPRVRLPANARVTVRIRGLSTLFS